MDAAMAALLGDGATAMPRATAATARAEAFTVHALLHGHALVDEQPLVSALRDQAVRLVIARKLSEIGAMQAASAPVGPSAALAREPIALVQALMRGHGLWAYAASATGR